jgi:hypothetical protein
MWFNLSHDNLVPLLGISMEFGRFPAIVTSRMTNGTHELWQQSIRSFWNVIIAIGLLSEYIKSDEEYDKMELVVDIARGVAYLHCELCLVLLILISYTVTYIPQRKALFIQIYEGYVQSRFTTLVTKTEIRTSQAFWSMSSEKHVWLTLACFTFSPTVLY